MKKKYEVFCLPPQDKPVYFVVETSTPVDDDLNEYIYSEGSCPTNFFIRGVEAIITNGNSDPHGLFEFVRTIEPEFIGTAHTPDDEWSKVLPEAYQGETT